MIIEKGFSYCPAKQDIAAFFHLIVSELLKCIRPETVSLTWQSAAKIRLIMAISPKATKRLVCHIFSSSAWGPAVIANVSISKVEYVMVVPVRIPVRIFYPL